MYALVRLRGEIEGVGFKAVVSGDVAQALGLRIGDAVRIESPDGFSGARVVEIDRAMKSGLLVTSDVYIALGRRARAVLLKKIERAFEASRIELALGTDAPISSEELRAVISAIASARVPVFAKFTGYLYAGGGWVRVFVKGVEPREPAYISYDTAVSLR
ncbi:MAG: molybdopterin-binding protein [Thermoproteus sp.]